MRTKLILNTLVSILVLFSLQSRGIEAQSISASSLAPPPIAPIRPVTDDYFRTKIADPYRYMENLQDPEVQAWMKAQNDYTRAVLDRIPGRRKLLDRIIETDLSGAAVVSDVRRLPGDLYFYTKLVATKSVPELYLRRGLDGAERLVIDPEGIALATPENQRKGKNAIQYFMPSPDGKLVAVGIAPGSSEEDVEIHVFDVGTGRETGDVILGSPCVEGLPPNWLPDSHSFVYGRPQKLAPGAPIAEGRQKFRSYLHVLGTDSKKDSAVFGYGVVPSIDVDPSLIASVMTTPGSRYALGVLNGSVTPNSAFYVAAVDSIGKMNPAWRKVADLSDGVTSIAIHGDDLYLLTYQNAPRYKIVRTDAQKTDLASAQTVVPPGEAVVTTIFAAQDALYATLLDGGVGRLLRIPYDSSPKVERVALPFDGSVSLESSDPRLSGALLDMTSWTRAKQIYAYDFRAKQVSNTKLQPSGPYDNPDLDSLEVKVPSYDGTLVPLSIIRPRGLKLDGSSPLLLYGYGAYGASIDPFFQGWMLPWAERGGIYAICHVRGGGEFGEEWHLAGKGPNKPNTWRDFIACAEYLISHEYTSPARLAGQAGSAGGVLIGRAITERPDLFAAAIDEVGDSDLLRSETTANGETNIPEYGSTKTEGGFQALYAMSPYHHIRDHTPYPAVMLDTGINDPNVPPWMSAKMAARLQAATTSGKPILLRVDYAAGHGSYSKKQLDEWIADEESFLLWQFGVTEFQPQR